MIDFINFTKEINIKKNNEKKKAKIHFENLSEIKNNLDKEETFSVNSLIESIDKTQTYEQDKNSKNIEINNTNNDVIIKKRNEKAKIFKNKINNTNDNILGDTPEEKIKNNLPENTYFDYLIKI